jgi:hypothetical protein
MSSGAIDPATPVAPSSPDPATVTLVAALLRHFLTTLAGAGFLSGLVVTDSTLMTIASALIWTGTVMWSWGQKYRAAKADHLGSVMSADLHRPVQPA